ncbi:MAG: A24 family peptidase [Microbacterium sp.]|uniref:prepilin peptidase n=1 Tax=Microbacterium sp. TaxID=51671 RepID=UPI0039E26284
MMPAPVVAVMLASAESGASSPGAVVTVLVAYLYLAAISVVLAVVDADVRRLPNAIVLPAYPVLLVLLTLACLFGAEWAALLRAVVGGAVLYLCFALLRLAGPGGMGGGDVKLAGVLGIALGWIGGGALVVGVFAAFLGGGLFSVLLLMTRRAGRRTAIPFGPWLLLGAWVGILWGERVASWYAPLVIVG